MIQIIIMVMLAGLNVLAGELVVADNGKSDYQIVYSENNGHPHLNTFCESSARELSRYIEQSTGAILSVCAESQRLPDRPAIFIGNTDALKQAGLFDDGFKRWEYRIDVKDKNIYLYGRDWRSSASPDICYYYWAAMGSWKAMYEFCERFMNVVFLPIPEKEWAASIPRLGKISVPDHFSFHRIPQFQYVENYRRGNPYDWGNNFLYCPWYGNYGGHSHYVAIPVQLFETHPEYFAVVNGERKKTPYQQYCLSNPEVQKLIYEEVLAHLDRGYEIVQLAQTDGFRLCECTDCAKMFDVEEPGEKLWILHRDMALRLLKDRAGKKVCIIAYGPTRTPPQTFKEFPENVVIELAPCNRETTDAWKNHKVPGGFVAYIYNWGYWHAEGFTPNLTWQKCVDQVKLFYDRKIHGIFRCGFGDLQGLEGPTYYIWGKLLEDPDRSTDELLRKYCAAAFGKGAAAMEKFYRALDQRLRIEIQDQEPDWNNLSPDPGSAVLARSKFVNFFKRYPDEVTAQLDSMLCDAEKQTDSRLMKLARFEFDHLQKTSLAVNSFGRYLLKPSMDNAREMYRKILDRNAYLDSLETNDNGRMRFNGDAAFGIQTKTDLFRNGPGYSALNAPFTWDAQWLLDHGVVPCSREISVDDQTPQYLVNDSTTREDDGYKTNPVRFSCIAEADALRVVFIRKDTTLEEMKKHNIGVFIGSERQSLRFFPGRLSQNRTGCYEYSKSNQDNSGNGDHYETGSKPGAILTVPAPGVETLPDECSAELKIPYLSLPRMPGKGEKWLFNVCYVPTIRSYKDALTWEHNFDQRSWKNVYDHYGTILF